MRVGEDLPEVGSVIDWDIAEIMERNSIDSDCYIDWEDMLRQKRGDSHYTAVKESISRWGFLRPLTAYTSEGILQFGDGHHRLAAAIELGLDAVPVEIHEDAVISSDSGVWAVIPDDIEEIKSVPYDEWY